MIKNIFPAICSDNVAATRDFYVELFGFQVVFDSGWYAHLDADGTQLGIVQRDHPTVPSTLRVLPAGVFVSIEVDDVDAVYSKLNGAPVHLSLRDEDFGQRHFITEDPSGTPVDVIKPIKPSPEFAAYQVSAAH